MDSIDKKIAELKAQLEPKRPLSQIIALDYPALLGFGGLLAGLIIQFSLPLPTIAAIIIICLCTTIYLSAKIFRQQKTELALTIFAVFLCFVSLGSTRLAKFFTFTPNSINRLKINDFSFVHIKGKIISEPRIVNNNEWLFAEFSNSKGYTTFYAKIESIKKTSGWEKAAGKIKFYISEPTEKFKIGSKFSSFCKIRKFYHANNPGQFDMADYMNRNGIFLSASVKSAKAVTLLQKGPTPKSSLKTKLQNLVTNCLLNDTEPDNASALVEALLLGKRSKINSQLYQDFIKTGLAHFISLSGLHVGIIAGLFWWLAKKIGLLHTGRAVVCILSIIIFLLIIPARTPTLRAGIMFAILFGGRIFSLRAKSINSLAIAAILILLIRPMDFLNAGFQLSFAAIAGIIIFSPSISKYLLMPLHNLKNHVIYLPLKSLIQMFAVSIAAHLAVGPILCWHFYTIQPLTAVWTIPAFFLVAAIIVGGVFKIFLALILPTIAGAIGFIVNLCGDGLVWMVSFFASLGPEQILAGKPHITVIAGFYAIILSWRFFKFRKPAFNFLYPAAIVLLFATAGFITKTQKSNQLTLTILAVGHGQAAIVQLPGKENIIIDCGSISNDIGNKIANPFLNYAGIKKIDSAFISHNDIDHYNGLPEVIKTKNITNIYTTPQFIADTEHSPTAATMAKFLKNKNLVFQIVPEKIIIGKTTITSLWPREFSDIILPDDNSASNVLLLEYAGRKILFCSDIPAAIQKQLMILYPDLSADIVITPHHGSARTLDISFLDSLAAEYLITSCSATRFANTSDKIKDSDNSFYSCLDGAITLSINQNGYIKTRDVQLHSQTP